ncbi:MAG: metal-dependent hydrolase [Candidatus Hydrogenedentota bacterium]
MTPLEHGLIGISLASVTENLFDTKKLGVSKKSIYWYFVLSSMAPDIDSISALKQGYYNNLINNIFLSHRGITHSIFGVIILSLLFIMFKYLKDKKSIKTIFSITFICGIIHLLCDLPNPSHFWNGIPVFFPMRVNGEWYRIGGWNKIGWYDYFIMYILFGVVFIDLFFKRFLLKDNTRRILILSLHFLSYVVIIIHIINSRYNAEADFYTAEETWLAYQYDILPDFLVDFAESIKYQIIKLILFLR